MHALGPITREQAIEIDGLYVKFREGCGARQTQEDSDAYWAAFEHIHSVQNELHQGQLVLTVALDCDRDKPQFIVAQVSSVKRNCIQAVDGPVIRVTDGDMSWRVDGANYCVPAR
ncbi:MAG: hypothetical protein M0R80_23615 [Proteobacteria bacterium]|jgi:hypothetical protein|nr:hypothetical protein [Pseudomonadota bacterium]